MTVTTWNVLVLRDGLSVDIGQVQESTHEAARCAALSRFSVSEDEIAVAFYTPDQLAQMIGPEDEFDVIRA